jgi:hypothetical protein
MQQKIKYAKFQVDLIKSQDTQLTQVATLLYRKLIIHQ